MEDVIMFNKYGIDGCAVLKRINDDGKYIYEMFWLNNAEDSGEYFFGIHISDKPITELVQPTLYYTFNKAILNSLVKNNEETIINKAKELNTEVFGEEYRNSSSYRGYEPWANMEDAIKIAQKEIAEGKVTEDVIELIINNALVKANKKTK